MNNHWILIQKFLRGHITDTEKEALEHWLNKEVKNRQKFDEIKEVWVLTKRSDEPVYNLEDEKLKVLQLIQSSEKEPDDRKGKDGFKMYSLLRVAAVILLMIVASFLTWMYSTDRSSSNLNGQILVSHDAVTKIDLPDSSIIYLNKESKVSFSQNASQRKVELHGEAYFEVEKGARPFIISVQDITVKVLGTSFNVKELKEGEIEVTVVSGKVEVSDGQENIIIRAGELAIVDRLKKRMETSLNTNLNSISWKTRKMVFKDMELKNVIYALSEYYDITFQIKTPEILDCRFTGSFEKARLETVMEVLAYSLEFEYYYMSDEYILSGKRCQQY